MTVSTLLSEVAALGFEREIDADTAFLSAANRALMQIVTECPLSAEYRLYLSEEPTSLSLPRLSHEAGECVTVPLVGGGYAFRVYGNGSFTVTDGQGSHTENFSGRDLLYRGLLSGEGTLRFEGAYRYTVLNLSVYLPTFPDAECIPSPGALRVYDLSKLTDDFLMPDKEIRRPDGQPVAGCVCEGARVGIPDGVFGEIVIPYLRRPARIVAEAATAVDVPPECEHLLALLTASYRFLDDDAEKAAFYLSSYRNGMGELRRSRSRYRGARYEVTNGWA